MRVLAAMRGLDDEADAGGTSVAQRRRIRVPLFERGKWRGAVLWLQCADLFLTGEGVFAKNSNYEVCVESRDEADLHHKGARCPVSDATEGTLTRGAKRI